LSWIVTFIKCLEKFKLKNVLKKLRYFWVEKCIEKAKILLSWKGGWSRNGWWELLKLNLPLLHCSSEIMFGLAAGENLSQRHIRAKSFIMITFQTSKLLFLKFWDSIFYKLKMPPLPPIPGVLWKMSHYRTDPRK